jgi:hypothetical protein
VDNVKNEEQTAPCISDQRCEILDLFPAGDIQGRVASQKTKMLSGRVCELRISIFQEPLLDCPLTAAGIFDTEGVLG